MFGKKTIQVLLALACFLLPFALYPGAESQETAGVWVRGEFEKSRVTHLTIGGQGDNVIRYAAPMDRGIYRNTDDFFFWKVKNNGLPVGLMGRIGVRALVASSHDPRRVYAALDNGNSGGVYRTVNGGAFWVLVDRELAGRAEAVAIAPSNDDVVYAAVNEGLYRSLDGGDSWVHLGRWPPGLPIASLRIDPENSERVYIGTQGKGFWQTHDGGTSWVVIRDNLDSLEIRAIAVAEPTSAAVPAEHRAAERVIYLGTDVGVYQVIVPENTLDQGPRNAIVEARWPKQRIHTLATDPANPDILYAGTSGKGVYRSGDGGRQWQAMNRGLGDADVYALAFDPGDPRVLYAGTSDGVWRCTISPFVPTATPLPTITPSATSSPTFTVQPMATVTPTSAPLPSATSTETVTPTSTLMPTETATEPPTPTPTKEGTWTPSLTVTATATPFPTATATWTAPPSPSVTATATKPSSPTLTWTPKPKPTTTPAPPTATHTSLPTKPPPTATKPPPPPTEAPTATPLPR